MSSSRCRVCGLAHAMGRSRRLTSTRQGGSGRVSPALLLLLLVALLGGAASGASAVLPAATAGDALPLLPSLIDRAASRRRRDGTVRLACTHCKRRKISAQMPSTVTKLMLTCGGKVSGGSSGWEHAGNRKGKRSVRATKTIAAMRYTPMKRDIDTGRFLGRYHITALPNCVPIQRQLHT